MINQRKGGAKLKVSFNIDFSQTKRTNSWAEYNAALKLAATAIVQLATCDPLAV
jgi:hypothetical protein